MNADFKNQLASKLNAGPGAFPFGSALRRPVALPTGAADNSVPASGDTNPDSLSTTSSPSGTSRTYHERSASINKSDLVQDAYMQNAMMRIKLNCQRPHRGPTVKAPPSVDVPSPSSESKEPNLHRIAEKEKCKIVSTSSSGKVSRRHSQRPRTETFPQPGKRSNRTKSAFYERDDHDDADDDVFTASCGLSRSLPRSNEFLDDIVHRSSEAPLVCHQSVRQEKNLVDDDDENGNHEEAEVYVADRKSEIIRHRSIPKTSNRPNTMFEAPLTKQPSLQRVRVSSGGQSSATPSTKPAKVDVQEKERTWLPGTEVKPKVQEPRPKLPKTELDSFVRHPKKPVDENKTNPSDATTRSNANRHSNVSELIKVFQHGRNPS